MSKTEDTISPVGNLEVWKVYPDGEEELHFSDHNVITSGMGVGLANLFSVGASSNISNFQILNFQVGVSGGGGDALNYGVSTNSVDGFLTEAQYRSTGSEALIENLTPIEGQAQDGTVAYAGAVKALVRIAFSNIHRVDKTNVRFNLVLDRYTANGLEYKLNEVGLFMRNPTMTTVHHPLLVAYRPFTDILKTDAFSIVFRWSILF